MYSFVYFLKIKISALFISPYYILFSILFTSYFLIVYSIYYILFLLCVYFLNSLLVPCGTFQVEKHFTTVTVILQYISSFSNVEL